MNVIQSIRSSLRPSALFLSSILQNVDNEIISSELDTPHYNGICTQRLAGRYDEKIIAVYMAAKR